MAELRGVQRCEECGWYIGKRIIKRDKKCANCEAEMKLEK
tara:strand:+ start:404 stop:523 length:120 start_codon:yes stop_codon:yes gene_type:complete